MSTTVAGHAAAALLLLLAGCLSAPSVHGANGGGGGGGDTSVTLEGSPTSYAQFRQWRGGANSTLELEFSTTQRDALLLYADSRATGEYVQLSLVSGAVRLRFNWGAGKRGMISAGEDLNADADADAAAKKGKKSWHRVAVINSGGDTSLVLDGVYRASSASFKKSAASAGNGAAKGGYFSAARGNQSYVYVGGLPSWYAEKAELLALPLVLLEPRLRGSVRRLRYRAIGGGGAKGRKRGKGKGGGGGGSHEAVQDMMAYKGARSNVDVDACAHRDPCLNGGRCLPTDEGPICDCSKARGFEGSFCHKVSVPLSVTFRGREYLTYDLSQRGVDPILSVTDRVSIRFKTRKPNGLLFYTGNEHDFLRLSLHDGGVSLGVQLGTGTLDTEVRPDANPNVRFDDNRWHHVLVTRRASEVSVTVDGVYTESWITSGSFSVLASSTVFVGGSEPSYNLMANGGGGGSNPAANNWIGCLEEVLFSADSLTLDLLRLGQDGHPLVSIIGGPEWKCVDIAPGSPLAYRSDVENFYEAQRQQQGGVISFTREEAFLVLPSWKVNLSGSISLKFRTNEKNGLLLYNGGGGQDQDYFAMELLDGHLHVHLDLGSGPVKVRASRFTLDDGSWHQVELTLKRKMGRITIDGETEAFETQGDATQLDLVGALFVGSVDYMDPYLRLPPTLWSGTLRYGFVGCLKDLFVNGAPYNVVNYAHQQDVGSIRSSCHKMPGQCHGRPCMHGGSCTEGWNRYVCDCSQTSFAGATCADAAGTLKFEGSHSMSLAFPEGVTTEADDLSLRFRTREQSGLLLLTAHDRSRDRLEVALESGRVRVRARMGSAPSKVFFAGQSLNDDIYHALVLRRRGGKITAIVDDDEPVIGEIAGGDTLLSYSQLYVGGVGGLGSGNGGAMDNGLNGYHLNRIHNGLEDDGFADPPGFVGAMQQLWLNGRRLFRLAASGQLSNHALNAVLVETLPEETVHHAVSFSSQGTYLGLPQMKVYDSIDLGFQFRTFEANGLLMYNAGKASDFIAVELINGKLHYTLNLGYGPISIKDNAPGTLSDNKWHRVTIGRPSRYKHTLMVDGHIATASTRGDNYHLDLDGILFLGGVRSDMYRELPRPLTSKSGFQGCFSSFETNGELMDPVKHALVPSPLVEEGCEESVAFEWPSHKAGGVVRYTYPPEKRPDTNSDLLSLGFITPSFDAVLVRVDSHSDGDDDHADANGNAAAAAAAANDNKDFLELQIIGGKIFVNYNLGAKDVTVGDISTKVNDGRYHVVRFSRSGVNSSLQIDDNPPHTKFPQGNRHLTVFNGQSSVQLGGRWNPHANRVERAFVGVVAGVNFNGLRPLERARDGDAAAAVEGAARLLPDGVPFDWRDRHPELFTRDAINAMMETSNAARAAAGNGGNGDGGGNGEIVSDSGNALKAHNSVLWTNGGAGDAAGNGREGGVGIVVGAGGHGGFVDCDDEEDCVEGSGSGDGDGELFPVDGGANGGGGGGGGGRSDVNYPPGESDNAKTTSPSSPSSPTRTTATDAADNGESHAVDLGEEEDADGANGGTHGQHWDDFGHTAAEASTEGLPDLYDDGAYDLYNYDKTTTAWYNLPPQFTTTTAPPYHGPPTLLPIPSDNNGEGSNNVVVKATDPDKTTEKPKDKDHVKAYDDKWNKGDKEQEPTKPKLRPDTPPMVKDKAMPATMVLVIGIILGAFVAMVLIVIIVLKMRTRVDGGIKCEDAPRYQFAPPNDYGDLGCGPGPPGAGGGGGATGGIAPGGACSGGDQETATTSLMEGMSGGGRPSAPLLSSANHAAAAAAAAAARMDDGGPVNSSNNGFFGSNCTLNGDRSRLFRKSNGSKPVREWYV